MQEEGKENQTLQSANKTNTYFLLSQLMPDQIIHRKLSPFFKGMQHGSPTLMSCSAHTNPHIHWLPCLPQGHGRFHLVGKRRWMLFSWIFMSKMIMRVRFPKNTKARYISSKPHDSSQRAWRAYLKSPSHRILQNTLFIEFTEIEVWRRLTKRSKNVKLCTKTGPGQVWPRAVHSCSPQTWSSAPEAQW